MARKLTKRLADSLTANPDRAVVAWDTDVKGLGIAVSRGGVKSFVLNYRGAGGRERRYTIGRFGEWTVETARAEARQLKAAVGRGEDPLAERRARRQPDTAPTVRDLAARYLEEHASKRSANTRRAAEMLFRLYLVPALGSRKVAAVTWSDLDALHRKLAHAPYQANRLLSLASKAWALAARWGWFPRDLPNPARGHDRHAEQPRGRALDRQQLARLGAALDQELEGASSVAALRFCLLTGCRPGEALAARWEDVDFTARVWRLPAAKTGPRAVHLGQPALEVLARLARNGSWLFAGRGAADVPLTSLRALWERVAARAELPEGLRLYDATRHTFATTAAELEVPRDVRQLLMGHAAGWEAHDRYMHATAVLLRAADLVAGELSAALRGEEPPDAHLLRFRR